MDTKIKVAILDDHQSIIDGYTFRINQQPGIEVVASTNYGCDLDEMMQNNKIDVLLLDISVPCGPDNTNAYPILHDIPKLLHLYPDLHILVISMYTQATMVKSVMDVGAHGYILKDDREAISDLAVLIKKVVGGKTYISPRAKEKLSNKLGKASSLTKRQLEALSLCAAHPGATMADLANKLGVAHSSYRNLLSGVYRNLNVENRTAAIVKARQLGLITPDSLDIGE